MKLNSLTKTEKQVLIISIILACFLLSYFIFYNKKVPKKAEEADTVEQLTPLPPKFSRITFFHTAKPICTLAIPESWEGKYRLKDNGNAAHFLFIQEDGDPELFYIKKYDINEKINEESEKRIWENKKKVYVSSLSTHNLNKFVHKDEYEKMMKDFDQILKSFKCF